MYNYDSHGISIIQKYYFDTINKDKKYFWISDSHGAPLIQKIFIKLSFSWCIINPQIKL
jgi:hypothetical protein